MFTYYGNLALHAANLFRAEKAMNFSLQATEISSKNIDRTSETFLLSPDKETQPDQNLADSIGRVGILSPPILMPRGSATFQIVTGWRRLIAWQARYGDKPVLCLVLEATTREEDCLAIALEDILRKRPATAVEIAFFFRKTGRHLENSRIAARYLPLLGLPANTATIECYLSLLELEDPIITAIHKGRLNEKLAFELPRLSLRDRLAVFEVVDQLNLSVSNQKKFFSGVAELAGRRKTSLMNILSDKETLAILGHPKANVPQQTAMLMNWLDQQRFPSLHKAEKAFRQFRKDLHLPKEMALEHALSFEKDTLTLSICFDDGDRLRHCLPRIREILTLKPPL